MRSFWSIAAQVLARGVERACERACGWKAGSEKACAGERKAIKYSYLHSRICTKRHDSSAHASTISVKKAAQAGARSADLVAAILEAATQVLAEEGAPRFTCARVAEKAGVSIGSLYQYFPNKAAILFRLQSDEWRQTTELRRVILEDVEKAAAGAAAHPGPRLHPLGM